jgi:hypothetical protein
MTTWTDILDAALEAEHVVTQETMFALRDNVKAFAEGATGAPTISAKNVGLGGANIAGDVTNPSWTDCGYYEVGNLTISSNLNLPAFAVIRVKGNLTISAIATAQQPTAAERVLAEMFGIATFGNDASGASGSADAGGGSIGDGGTQAPNVGGAGKPLTGSRYFWATRRGIMGGNGLNGGSYASKAGGGIVIFIVEGNVVATGGTIKADGAGGGANGTDGGGGGSVVVIATGTITDGTYYARGGSNFNSGAGGGGWVSLVASAFAGSRTKDVTSQFSSGTAGTSGLSEETTLTAKEIQGTLVR